MFEAKYKNCELKMKKMSVSVLLGMLFKDSKNVFVFFLSQYERLVTSILFQVRRKNFSEKKVLQCR